MLERRFARRPDLIFTPEDPPIPTTFLAVDEIGGQALIKQVIDNEDIYSIISHEKDWVPRRLDKKDMVQAIKMGNGHMIPVEYETEEPIEYSSTAELVAELDKIYHEYSDKQPRLNLSKEEIEHMVEVMRKNMEEGKVNLLEGL